MQRLLRWAWNWSSGRARSPGNASLDDLRADLRELTPAERVERAMELNEFLTGVTEVAGHEPR